MERRLRWATEEGNGLEYVAVRATPQGVVADGVVIGPDSGIPYEGRLFGCSYAIHCDARWRVRLVEVRVAGGAHLLLRADGEG
ncbi:putative glycolipid-binding domain-containing protein, partial [Massilia timonae]